MTIPALTSIYQFLNAIGLLDGALLNQFIAEQVSATGDTSITALAGGGAAGAPLMNLAYNRVTVVATNSDSVLLPYAIPGTELFVDNDSANTLAVFAQTANPNNAGGVADKIVAQSSLISGGGAASVTQATGISTAYICTKAGFWKAD